jgi:hypothetical protein
MTEIPTVPASSPSPSPEEDAAFERMRTDAVLGGRAMSAGVFLAGLVANGMLATVGRPDKLPADLWPGVDPAVVQEIFERGLAVGLHAGKASVVPRLYRDQMQRVEEEFAAIGFEAMRGLVARSRRLVAPEMGAHPVDGEDARGH